MARNQSACMQWSQYIPLRGLAAVVSAFPMSINIQTSRWIGDLFYHCDGKRTARAIQKYKI